MTDYNNFPISIEKLLTICRHPYENEIWIPGQVVKRDIITRCIERGRLLHPKQYEDEQDEDNCTMLQHHERIAWLVVNGWEEPIEVDFGVSFGRQWYPLQDGHHRLAAAIYRNELFILASCSGSISRIEEYRYPEATKIVTV
jgi:hypothetical protein